MAAPLGIAYADGKIYVANLGQDSITVYSAAANGAVKPQRKIQGDHTHLDHPSAVAVDASGAIYVTNRTSDVNGHDSVTVYAPGTDGDAAPRAIVSGPSTGLRDPVAIAVDSHGAIYVSNGGSTYVSNGVSHTDRGGVMVYAVGASGDAKPIREISGDKTNLSSPQGIALDSSDQLYVTTVGTVTNPGPGIAIFAAGADGNVAPIASPDACFSFSGNWPLGPIALDPRGNIYVTQYGGENQPRILFFQRIGTGSPPDYFCTEDKIVRLGGPATKVTNIDGIAVDSVGDIYVSAAEDSDSISVFQVGDTNTPPSATISSGEFASMYGALAIAFDRKGDIYVAKNGISARAANAIDIFATESNAVPPPIATISGDYGPDYVGDPEAVAVDAHGELYVANQGVQGADLRESLPPAIDVYSRRPDGRWVRSGRITGKKTGIEIPSGLAFDRAGNLYLLDNGRIEIFAPGAKGDVRPKAIIANGKHDQNTRLDQPIAMTLDAADNIYVTNDGYGQSAPAVTAYKAGRAGNVSPMATITGAKTGLAQPQGIAVAADGRIYVANQGSPDGAPDKITVYAPGAHGDAAPIATISGSATGLDGPAGIAIGPAVLSQGASRLLASYDWSVKASPSLASAPPSDEVVKGFMRAIQLTYESLSKPDQVCAFNFANLRDDGFYSMVVGMAASGMPCDDAHRGFYRAVYIVDRTTDGFEIYRNYGAYGVPLQTFEGIRDLNHDGKLVVVAGAQFAPFGNGYTPRTDQCSAVFPMIFGWTGSTYAILNDQYKDFYREQLDELNKMIPALPASGPGYDQRDRKCIEAAAARIERFLGTSPAAGTDEALKYARSAKPDESLFGIYLIGRDQDPRAEAELRAMAGGADKNVAGFAKQWLALRQESKGSYFKLENFERLR